ncbi:hypothetical protein HHI36_000250 [Cryptolaemus montrouzieri]|uniref:Ig-like domain-containing protein n=1 Tax=Cryptolaemus montrouzieri TaxID=559131 RepID=A0ABD2P520_9CUCU
MLSSQGPRRSDCESHISSLSNETSKIQHLMISQHIVATSRLGDAEKRMPRLVLVTFSNPIITRKLLRNKKILLTIANFRTFSIDDDVSPQQANILKKAREELQLRQPSGETNLTIRYLKGIPTVVKTNEQILSLLRRKKSLWQRYLRCRSRLNYDTHRQFANHLSLSIQRAKKAFEENLVTSKDRKKLFKYLRSSLSSKVSIPMVRRSTGEQCDGSAECASIFVDVFVDSYSVEPDGPIPRVRLTLTLTALKQDGVKLATFSLGKSIEIGCNATSDDKNEKIEIEWSQNGNRVEDVESLKGRFHVSQKGTIHKLVINDAKEEDIGNYTCSTDDEKEEEDIPVFLKPAVKLPSSTNTVELEKLKIVCTVYGKPYSEISWTFSNDTYNYTDVNDLNNDRITLEDDPEKGIENAVLLIRDVQMWDRGSYTCFGQPPYGHRRVNSTTEVRVKDKYAALWPFLGICAEVFVLCAIILIYEKKRNKTELEESDTDQSPDQKNTPDHNKDSNLRHRQ